MRIKVLFYIVSVLLILSACVFSQSPSGIKLRCPAPNGSVYGSVIVRSTGDIKSTPCPTRSTVFTGGVDFTGATVTGLPSSGDVLAGGAHTTNFFPNWSNGVLKTISDTPFSYNGTTYVFNQTAGLAADAFRLEQRSSNSGTGLFAVGKLGTLAPAFTVDEAANEVRATTANFTADTRNGVAFLGDRIGLDNTFTIDDSSNQINLLTTTLFMAANGNASYITSGIGKYVNGANIGVNTTAFTTGVVSIGDIGAAHNGTLFNTTDTSKTFQFSVTGNTGILDFGGIVNFTLQRTITAAGTVGAQTINKPAGTVNFAAGATTLVVTNSTVTANSIINVVARTNDATCSVKNYVPTGNSFTINMTAACTAETSVGFIVQN